MSRRLVTWAMDEAPLDDATQVLILAAMADQANDDGYACWYGHERLARIARCSPRTIRRHLDQMETAGVIARVEDWDHPAFLKIRPDRRPVPWRVITTPKERADRMTARPDDRPNQVPRPDKSGSHGRTPVSYDSTTNSTTNPKKLLAVGRSSEHAPAQARGAADDIDVSDFGRWKRVTETHERAMNRRRGLIDRYRQADPEGWAAALAQARTELLSAGSWAPLQLQESRALALVTSNATNELASKASIRENAR